MSNPPTTEPTPQPPTPALPPSADSTMPPAPATTAAEASTNSVDTSMADAAEVASSPAPIPQAAASAPSPAAAPARTGTPSRNLNNGEASSRAGSVHPDANAVNLPSQATPHGDSARMYINSTVTAALLEGMKIIGRDQPADPLRVLGEFLIQKSRERGEGTNAN
ncbi:dpy-30 domain-containing protein [Colletotrichum truncatum]|uniref:Dpy-30 domain-containing protein n=1 Tax=Colletotrichum truncatum TaxID=5467 RepID=A0ACC3Z560_COLTU|nr:dpy-30 domain-containing protein [Colletotrichum truncatum]KAF6795072.1 dpy-30 domain-containing protein [Colletotrichum truncatum]